MCMYACMHDQRRFIEAIGNASWYVGSPLLWKSCTCIILHMRQSACTQNYSVFHIPVFNLGCTLCLNDSVVPAHMYMLHHIHLILCRRLCCFFFLATGHSIFFFQVVHFKSYRQIWWKFWGLPPALHFVNYLCVSNGYCIHMQLCMAEYQQQSQVSVQIASMNVRVLFIAKGTIKINCLFSLWQSMPKPFHCKELAWTWLKVCTVSQPTFQREFRAALDLPE